MLLLDAHSERAVQQALDTALARRAGRRITRVIAHRLAAAQHADRIVEQGSHAHQRLATGCTCARLAALQFAV